MPAKPCPKDSSGNLQCSSGEFQTSCISLFQYHQQECSDPDAAGGWVECADIDSNCDPANYWINKDEIVVQHGCAGMFSACYTKDIPNTNIRSMNIECLSGNQPYKECKVVGASFVDSVSLRAKLDDSASCVKGSHFGIFKDSLWIKQNCSGIYAVDYYPEKDIFPPVIPQTPAPKQTTKISTTKSAFPGGNIFTDSVTHRQSPKNVTFSPISTSTVGAATGAPPTTIWTEGLIGITIGVLCGAFLMLLLSILAFLWCGRRYKVVRRYLDREKKTSSAFPRDVFLQFTQETYFDDSRHYEEIQPRDSVTYESQPFICARPPSKTVNGNALEQNNNPSNPLGENYFILEPNTFRANTPPQMGVTAAGDMAHFRQKYALSDTQRRPSEPPMPIADCRFAAGPSNLNSDRSNTVGPSHFSVHRQSPHAFERVPTAPGQFSLDRRPNNTPTRHSPFAFQIAPHQSSLSSDSEHSSDRQSPHRFKPIQSDQGLCSLERRVNCRKHGARTVSVSSQTDLDSGLDEEGYDKVEEFRKAGQSPSDKPHHYDQVQLNDTISREKKHISKGNEMPIICNVDHTSC